MIKIDPRTKMLLMCMTVLFSIFVPTGVYTCVWISMITMLGILLGRIKKTVRSAVVFAAFLLFATYILPMLGGTMHTSSSYKN